VPVRRAGHQRGTGCQAAVGRLPGHRHHGGPHGPPHRPGGARRRRLEPHRRQDRGALRLRRRPGQRRGSGGPGRRCRGLHVELRPGLRGDTRRGRRPRRHAPGQPPRRDEFDPHRGGAAPRGGGGREGHRLSRRARFRRRDGSTRRDAGHHGRGAPDAFERARPLLEAMGRPTHVGPAGTGQFSKLVNQM
ncbi:MAG: 2-hydroxy-3-oxopropionate reductase, partial [uncultured Acetobacteraceae bacterium]